MHSRNVKKIKIIWFQGVSCNGNVHSFLNLDSIASLLDKFEILYHPLLPSKYKLCEIVSKEVECDIFIFDGSYDPELERCSKMIKDVVPFYCNVAKHIIALGSCASFGGIFKEVAPDRISGLLFDGATKQKRDFLESNKVINISGCPIHPEWLAFVLNMILQNKEIQQDNLHRPIELYSDLAHHGCTRNEYFEWKVDSVNFGQKEGCLFYKQGCRAPMTHANCNKILWSGVSSKTRVGTPCFGCTESDFPRKNLFTTKTNMSIPEDIPLGVPKRSYLTLAGVAKTFHIKRLEGKLIDYKRAD